MKLVYRYIIVLSVLVWANTSLAQSRISVYGQNVSGDNIDLTNAILTVNSPSNGVIESVHLKLYDGRFINDAKLFEQSEVFDLQPGFSKRNILELFNRTTFSKRDLESKYLTFALVDDLTGMQKGFTTITTFGNGEKKSLKDRKGTLNIEGDISLRSIRSLGAMDSVNLASNDNLEIHAKTNVYGVPISLDGLYSNFRDPIDNRPASYFNIRFLSEEWRRKQRSRAESQINSEAQRIFPLDAVDIKASKRYDYLDKVFKTQSVSNDLEILRDLYDVGKDSLLSFEELLERIFSEEKELNRQYTESLIDSSDFTLLSDSVNQIKFSLSRLIKYQELIDIRDSCLKVKQRVSSKLKMITTYKNTIYSDPKKLNSRLSQIGDFNDFSKFLNYVDKFNIGLLDPQFSRYTLATSQNKGIQLGINLGRVSIEGVYLSALQRNLEIGESNEILPTTFAGGKVEIRYNEVFSNNIFYLSSIDDFDPRSSVKSQFGHGLQIKRKGRETKLETVWAFSRNDSNEHHQNFFDLFSNAAIDLTHSRKGKMLKHNWVTNVKFVGHRFSDFNNPFLFNNNLSINSKLGVSLLKNLRSNINANYQKANLQGNTSALNSRFSIGASNVFNKRNWPILMHAFHYGAMNINGNSVKTSLQSLSAQFDFSKNGHDIQSNALISWNANNSKLDSLNNSFVTISFTNLVSLNSRFALNIVGDYSESKQANEAKMKIMSIEVSPEITVGKLMMNFGLKFLSDNDENRLGWLARIDYELGKRLRVNIHLDSSIFERFVNHIGETYDNFYEQYSASINYKF